jgi:hypothetical protein
MVGFDGIDREVAIVAEPRNASKRKLLCRKV